MKVFIQQLFLMLFLFYPISKKIIYYKSRPDIYQLQLISDSTFFYQVDGGFHLRYAEGIWRKIDKNTILLQSKYLDLNNLPISVVENKYDNQDSLMIIELKCDIPDDEKYYLFSLILDDSIIIYSNNKIFKLPFKSNFSKINFRIYFTCKNCTTTPLQDSIATRSYYIQNKSNHYKVTLEDVDPKYFFYEIIKNDTIILKKNKLFWPKKNLILYKYKPNTN